MPTQTEILAALDDAYEACREQYGDADEAGNRLTVLRTLRERIAKGPTAWRRMEFGNWFYEEQNFYMAKPLYAITGDQP